MRTINGLKRVVIVNAGERMLLSAKKGSYDTYVNAFKRGVDNINEDTKEKSLAPVEVVKSIKEVKLEDVDVLIFVSLSMLLEAREIKKKFPHLKIMVATGLLPEGEVVIVDKSWLTPELLYEFSTGY